MSPRRKAQLIFASALTLLLLSGVSAYVSIIQLLKSESWVTHSRKAQAAIGDVESATTRVGRARMGYVATGDEAALDEFVAASAEVPPQLQRLKELIQDNPTQRELFSRLEKVTEQRVALARQAVELKKAHPQDEQGQEQLTRQSVPLLSETTALMQQMHAEEQGLLRIREQVSHRLSALTFAALAVTLLLALAMFFVHYRLLARELHARERAEQALRGLSARLMQVQDEERRKLSRELHDSLGQYLAAVKMTLTMLSANHPEDRRYSECMSLLDQSIAETRTISHLLHPPLLDLSGFSSAAKWFVEGFAQRSGIQVDADISDAANRLSAPLELALFRVLQESLTNIHHHSRSARAEVTLEILSGEAMLTIRDYGVGIPADVLQRFRSDGASGVGLAAMRERIRDLGGRFEVDSGPDGTTISVTVPLPAAETLSSGANAAD